MHFCVSLPHSFKNIRQSLADIQKTNAFCVSFPPPHSFREQQRIKSNRTDSIRCVVFRSMTRLFDSIRSHLKTCTNDSVNNDCAAHISLKCFKLIDLLLCRLTPLPPNLINTRSSITASMLSIAYLRNAFVILYFYTNERWMASFDCLSEICLCNAYAMFGKQ